MLLVSFSIYKFVNFAKWKTSYIVSESFAEKIVNADEVKWKIYFNREGNSSQELKELLHKDAKKIKDFLLKNGFSENEIEKGRQSVDKNESGKDERIPKYQSEGVIIIKTKQLELVRKLYIKISEIFAPEIEVTSLPLQYVLKDIKNLEKELIDEAVKKAKENAEIIAKETERHVRGIRNLKLGKISSKPRYHSSPFYNSYEINNCQQQILSITASGTFEAE